MFDAGALLFKIQTVGAQAFRQDQESAEKAVEKTGRAAQASAGQVEKLGTSTDATGKMAKAAKAPLDEQAQSTKKTGDESESASQKQKQQVATTEQQIAAAKQLSAAMLLAGTAVAAAITLAVVKSAEFDSAMSNVRAATMATAGEQKALGDAALKAGADTAYSASEAAAAEEELAKAGQTVSEIVGGSLNASLALAAAGQLQVARSAEIMATAMTQYGIGAENAAHVSDVLAAGAGKAQGSVDDLALALTYVGPLAASAGWSIDETSGALAYFASQGILGEKAGTSLRGVLAALQAPSSIAQKVMEQYGLSIYDANGNMLSAAQIAGNLQTAFGDLTQEERNAALGRIFGNESLVAANLLYEGGSEKVAKWTDAVDDAGYAARQASVRQDNLAGDIEKLGGAFDTALIKTGSNANDVLRTMVQALTGLVDMYGEAPAPIQATAMIVGVAAAAMLLFAGGAVGARAKFLELKAQLDATNASMGRTALVGGIVGIALTGVITIVGMLMARQAEARQRAESFADALEQGADAARSYAADLLTAEQSFLWISRGSAADAAETLGLSMDLVADAATGNAEALEKVNKALDSAYAVTYSKAAKDVTAEEAAAAEAASVLTGVLSEVNASYEDGTKIQEQRNEITDESVETSQSAAEAYIAEADSVEDLNSQLSDLIDRINEVNGVNQDAVGANAEWLESLAGISEEVARQKAAYEEANGTLDGFALSLDESTAAGANNASMLAGVAAAAQDAATKQFEVDQATMSAEDATAKYSGTLAAQRQAFIDSAIQAGYNAAQVQALADKVFALPSEKEIAILAETAIAQNSIDRLIINNSGRRITITADVNYQAPSGITVTPYANGGVVLYNAAGNLYPSENHMAQLARGGAVRVWNEPETGGEAYVPLAPSKRARSEQILAETASIFGGTYLPPGSQHFADGGSTASGSGSRVVALLERIAAELGRPNLSIVNPVSRDAVSDAWEAAQMVGIDV